MADGETVMVHLTYQGLHVGEIHGIEPTGTRVEIEEYLTVHVEDGVIAPLDWLGDDLALLCQFGASFRLRCELVLGEFRRRYSLTVLAPPETRARNTGRRSVHPARTDPLLQYTG